MAGVEKKMKEPSYIVVDYLAAPMDRKALGSTTESKNITSSINPLKGRDQVLSPSGPVGSPEAPMTSLALVACCN